MSLIDKYTEVFRYFSPAKRALIAITTEGAVLSRRIEDEDWRHSANKKPEIAIDDWISRKREACAKLPAWATQVEELPSFDDVQFWIVDGKRWLGLYEQFFRFDKWNPCRGDENDGPAERDRLNWFSR